MQYALLQPSNTLEECPDYYRLIQDLIIIEERLFLWKNVNHELVYLRGDR